MSPVITLFTYCITSPVTDPCTNLKLLAMNVHVLHIVNDYIVAIVLYYYKLRKWTIIVSSNLILETASLLEE